MGILVALFIFGQTYADTTWTTYGATLENTHFQKMVGAMEVIPNVKWSYVAGGGIESFGATVADVDVDGTMEVVVGSNNRKIYCLNGTTGMVKWSYLTRHWVYSSPAIADVDVNGTMEVVFGSYDSTVYCLNGATGVVKWSYATGDFVHSSPAVADVDGDGTIEVIIGGRDDKIYCLDGATGGIEWSYLTGHTVYSSPALADIDGDGIMEVVIGSNDSKVYCLNGATGVVKWSYLTGFYVYSSPAIADVDGDGVMEVVTGSWDDKVYCLDGVTGALEWSYLTGGDLYSSPAIADVDGDGVMEVVVGSYDSTVYCLDGVTGGIEWSYYAEGNIHRGVSIADLDGDISGECKLEILVPNVSTDLLVCLNGENGSILWTMRLDKDIHDITIADIDNDNCVEIILGTGTVHAIWALDDVENRSNCECDSSSNVEERNTRGYGIEFKAMGKGIYLFTPNAMQVDINVYDVSGKLEQIIYKGVLSKGVHTFIPNIKSSGVHFIVLKSSNFSKSVKLIKLAY